MDGHWHAACPAISKGVEGAEWEKLYCKFVDLNEAVIVRHPSGSSRAQILWKVGEAEKN